MTNVRYIAICLDQDCGLDIARLKAHPGAELYYVDASSPDLYGETSLAILKDLHSPVKLAVVGDHLAKAVAETYWSTWIDSNSTENATEDVLTFWDAPCDDPWNLPTGVDLVQFEIYNNHPSS